jgi:preprotein translocase subunit SecD
MSWKLVTVLVITITAIVYIIPTIHMEINGLDKPTLWPKKKINLGLDLQGGMHLVLEVETEKALESTIERIGQDMRSLMKKERIRHGGIERVNGTNLSIRLKGEKSIDRFNELLDKEYRDLKMVSRPDGDVTTILLSLPDKDAAHIKAMARDQALETIRNRIDQFGVSEPDIRRQGEKRILMQLPGIKDTERAKKLIGKTALLEFKLLNETGSLDAALKGNVPPGSEVLEQIVVDRETQRVRKNHYLVKKRTLLTGANLMDARVEFNRQYNDPFVSIKFDKKGAKTFAKVTEENVNKRLAIVLDNKVYSAPVIQEKIAGGEARITGSFTDEEAKDLAIALRAGALPAPVKILEERTVGPSLGADSIRKGIISMIIGGLIVVIFIAIYYKLSGLIADLALVANILFITGALAAFQATLTLPGMAAIILTIGMAIDANVLIFERIREEVQIGKTPRAAVEAGYDRATLTILDANVTTLIAALVLFQFGTGPVKGFAVTLSIGVIASLISALLLTRIIFDYLLIKRKSKALSI